MNHSPWGFVCVCVCVGGSLAQGLWVCISENSGAASAGCNFNYAALGNKGYLIMRKYTFTVGFFNLTTTDCRKVNVVVIILGTFDQTLQCGFEQGKYGNH